MEQPEYVAARTADDFELERLGILQAIGDPRTRERVEMLGIHRGWSCLEVAAGAGSVASWLAEQVAPSGRVVATDIDTRFLDALDAPGLEVRKHNILSDDLERDAFDLVHCRALLLHLPDRDLALARMVGALKPGGWLFVEDYDYQAMAAADPTHPESAEFNRIMKVSMGYFVSAGILDASFGARLRGVVEALGLVEFGHAGLTSVMRGGELGAHFSAIGAEMTRPLLVGRGVLTDEEVDAHIRRLEDPNFMLTDCVTYQCWGRKPS